MNNRYGLAMQVSKALQNLMAPFLYNFQLWLSHLLKILSQTASCNNLSDEIYLFGLLTDPSSDKSNDVWVVQFLYQLYFRLDSWSLRFWESS